jgi:cation-transporting P-type ATPase I
VPLLRIASLGYLIERVTGRDRRTWIRDGRAHVEYRDVPEEILPEYLRLLSKRLLQHQDIEDVELLPATGRLLVRYDDLWMSEDQLEALFDEIEADLGVDEVAFSDDRADHPGDVQPLLRDVIHLGADTAAIGTAAVGMLLRWVPRPRIVDLGWVVSASENFLPLRHAVEERIGVATTDLLLGVTGSIFQGLARNVTSPVVDMAHRTVQALETTARYSAWFEREPELAALGPARWSGELVPATRDRPVPLPEGIVERYADRAWYASVSGLTSTVAATNDLDRAVTPLLDALPKAARLGREAFCARLGRILSARGVIVMDEESLRLLDRVDAIVLPRELLVAGRQLLPGAREVLAAARSADLHVVLATRDGRLPRGLDVDEVVEVGEAYEDLEEEIRNLQIHGMVVAAVGTSEHVGLPSADVAIGLVREGTVTPWGADLIGRADLADVFLVLRACAAAREASEQSIWLALAGSGIGAGVALGGMQRSVRHRVVRIVDTAAFLSILNGLRLAGPLGDVPESLEPDTEPWHAMAIDDVLERLGTTEQGLADEEATRRHVEPVESSEGLTLLSQSVIDELVNPLTPILAAGAGLSLATGAVADAGMVGSVIGLNALVGGYQNYRTERAVAQLDEVSDEHIRVRRGGEIERVPVTELVPGDVVELEPGETVPADCRLLEADGLEVDESSLTGESLPVEKTTEPVDAAAVADRRSMVYDGTSIAAGEALAVVVAVGAHTEARRALAATALERERTHDGGVEARLRELTNVTIPMAVGSGLGVAAAGLARQLPTQELIDASIGLAVAAVPEGLPILATVAQLAAARRLSEKAVLVRNPRAIEALGRVDVVCADKTGTLTEGRIRLTHVSDGETRQAIDELDETHEGVLLAARRATPIRPGGPLPHPTDQAIAEGTEQAGIQREAGGSFEILDDVPFEPGRSFHAVLAEVDEGRVLAVKGAPEVILERCLRWVRADGEQELDDELRAELEAEGERLASTGARVLAVAERPLENGSVDEHEVDRLTFLGFVGLSDPVRPVAAQSVEDLRAAGVDVMMITGDHPLTARGIAAELGLDDGKVITGPELDELDDLELREVLPDVTVCARVTPAHKVRIVRALQRTGRTVAMTGDGANDAPAIRLADVGIALGKRATAAAREAADLVVTEERLEVIVDAIAEGRGLWSSVRDAIAVLVGGNVGEISYTLLGTLVGRRPPLNARQLLLINLLTDVAPATAISVRPPTESSTVELLQEGPEASLGTELNRAIAWRGAGTALGATWAYSFARVSGTRTRARTVGLVSLVGAQLGQTIAASGGDTRVIATGVGSAAALAGIVQTPGVSRLAGSRPVGPFGWSIAMGGAAIGTAIGVMGPSAERVYRRLRGEDEPGEAPSGLLALLEDPDQRFGVPRTREQPRRVGAVAALEEPVAAVPDEPAGVADEPAGVASDGPHTADPPGTVEEPEDR